MAYERTKTGSQDKSACSMRIWRSHSPRGPRNNSEGTHLESACNSGMITHAQEAQLRDTQEGRGAVGRVRSTMRAGTRTPPNNFSCPPEKPKSSQHLKPQTGKQLRQFCYPSLEAALKTPKKLTRHTDLPNCALRNRPLRGLHIQNVALNPKPTTLNHQTPNPEPKP